MSFYASYYCSPRRLVVYFYLLFGFLVFYSSWGRVEAAAAPLLVCTLDDSMPAVDPSTYYGSKDRLSHLLALPSNSTLVSELQGLLVELGQLAALRPNERAFVFDCFEKKRFLFGASHFYMNEHAFDVFLQGYFEGVEHRAWLLEFKRRFIPKLDCSATLPSRAVLKADPSMSALFSLLHFWHCPSKSLYESVDLEAHPALVALRTIPGILGMSKLAEYFDAFILKLIKEDWYLGLHSGTTLSLSSSSSAFKEEGDEEDLNRILIFLQSKKLRPFLTFIYHPSSSGLNSLEAYKKQKQKWDGLTRNDFESLPNYFYLKLKKQLGQLVQFERDHSSQVNAVASASASASHLTLPYLKWMANQGNWLWRSMPVRAQIWHLLLSPISISELKSLPFGLVIAALKANGLQKLAVQEGTPLSLADLDSDWTKRLLEREPKELKSLLQACIEYEEKGEATKEGEIISTSTRKELNRFLSSFTFSHLHLLANSTGALSRTELQRLFFSGHLSFTFYQTLEANQLLWIVSENEFSRPSFVAQFQNLSLQFEEIEKEKKKEATKMTSHSNASSSSFYLFQNIFRAEMNALLSLESFPEKEAFLALFRPLDWAAFEALPIGNRSLYYLQIGYLDSIALYTQMNASRLALIFKALNRTEHSGKENVSSFLLRKLPKDSKGMMQVVAESVNWLKNRGVVWSLEIENQEEEKLTLSVYTKLFNQYKSTELDGYNWFASLATLCEKDKSIPFVDSDTLNKKSTSDEDEKQKKKATTDDSKMNAGLSGADDNQEEGEEKREKENPAEDGASAPSMHDTNLALSSLATLMAVALSMTL